MTLRLLRLLVICLLGVLVGACPGTKSFLEDDDDSAADDDDTGPDDDDTGDDDDDDDDSGDDDDDDTGHGDDDDDDTGHGDDDDDDTGHGDDDDDDTGHGDDDDDSGAHTGDDDDSGAHTGDDDDATGDDDDDSGSAHGDDDDDSTSGVDVDGDGVDDSVDCDDFNDQIYPGAPELCDGLDNDCDGNTWAGSGEGDVDNDGVLACEDCDDNNGQIYPTATELCDGIDNDCDATTWAGGDEGDADGDGVLACEDCNDTNDQVYPAATELCDGLDNDCDSATTAPNGGEGDADNDGAFTCEDCDDNDPAQSPWFVEFCDGIDNNCSGTLADSDADENVSGSGAGSPLPPSATNDVAELTAFLDWDGEIVDVNVEVVLSHTAPEDLDIVLVSPDGTSIELATDCGAGGSDWGSATFDDEAQFSISSEAAPFSGDYQPEESMQPLQGEGGGGTWTLQITDDDPSADTGSVISWTVILVLDGTIDNDGDTMPGCNDCNDALASVFPGAPEICDGYDTDCDGTGDSTPYGDDVTCPGDNCHQIQTVRPTAPDGIYWVDPGGLGGFETFCDLNTTAMGGWTLAANVADSSDPYYTGTNDAAWIGTSTVNPSSIATYSYSPGVSTKYRTWSELTVADVMVYYKSDGSNFICYGLGQVNVLSGLFNSAPSPGACSVQCSWFVDNRLPAGSTMDPTGINCSDADQGWWTTDTTAQNARIGGTDANAPGTSLNAFVGGMGTRTWTTALEHTWGDSSSGVVAEDDILIFVR